MIRQAELSDLDKIVAIENHCFFKDAQSKRSLKYLINSKTTPFFVFVENDKILGTMILFTRSNSKRLRIYSLAVDPTCQGKGIGTQLLAYSKEYASNHNFELLTLEVKESNIKAMDLYKLFGFEPKGLRSNYYYNGESGIVMHCNDI